MRRQEAIAYRRSIEQAASMQSDEQALENIDLYPSWKQGIDVKVDERYRYEDTLYKCVQAHKTQVGWEPDKTPALWTVVSLDEWPKWKKPTGAQDAYMIGDKVHFPTAEDAVYVSTADNNVWSPDVYGWEVEA